MLLAASLASLYRYYVPCPSFTTGQNVVFEELSSNVAIKFIEMVNLFWGEMGFET